MLLSLQKNDDIKFHAGHKRANIKKKQTLYMGTIKIQCLVTMGDFIV